MTVGNKPFSRLRFEKFLNKLKKNELNIVSYLINLIPQTLPLVTYYWSMESINSINLKFICTTHEGQYSVKLI